MGFWTDLFTPVELVMQQRIAARKQQLRDAGCVQLTVIGKNGGIIFDAPVNPGEELIAFIDQHIEKNAFSGWIKIQRVWINLTEAAAIKISDI